MQMDSLPCTCCVQLDDFEIWTCECMHCHSDSLNLSILNCNSVNSSFWDTSLQMYLLPCRCCIQLDDFKVWTCEYLWIPDGLGRDASPTLPPHVCHQRDKRGDRCRRNALARWGHLSLERGSRSGHTSCHRFVHQHRRRVHNHTAVRMPFNHPSMSFN